LEEVAARRDIAATKKDRRQSMRVANK